MKRFTVALDVDDVLAPCLEEGCRILGLDYDKITDWDLNRTELTEEERLALMRVICSAEFVAKQKPYPGAAELVRELVNDGHEVLIASAVNVECMSRRSEMLIKYFPMLQPKNIMLGARKELLHVDFLLDDSPYNYGHAKYFVLMERPYNKGVKGYLSVKDYAAFLAMVRQAASAQEDNLVHVGTIGRPGVICLVGPSASGKSFLCDELEKNPIFRKVRAMTDRPPRAGEVRGKEYLFVSEREFRDAVAAGKLLEHTVYDGHCYGIFKEEIERIWSEGRIAIKPVDIHGAKAIKEAYPDRTLTLFVRRNREDLLKALIERDEPAGCKVNRIMGLDSEYRNELMCDWTISNDGSLNHAVEQVLRLL